MTFFLIKKFRNETFYLKYVSLRQNVLCIQYINYVGGEVLRIIWKMNDIECDCLQEVLDKASQSSKTKESVRKIDESLYSFQADVIMNHINQQPISYEAKVNLLESIKQQLKVS